MLILPQRCKSLSPAIQLPLRCKSRGCCISPGNGISASLQQDVHYFGIFFKQLGGIISLGCPGLFPLLSLRFDQRLSNSSIRVLSNPATTSPSTTRAGVDRTPRLSNSSRASSSIMTSFMANATFLLVRYSASAPQGPQKGCEYKVICRSRIIYSMCFAAADLLRLIGLLLPCFL